MRSGSVTDQGTDRSTLVDLQTVGLATRDPKTGELVRAPGLSVGRMTATGPALSKVDRPDQWVNPQVRVQARQLNRDAGGVLAPGTVRRNVAWPVRQNGGRGLFSSAANMAAGPGGRAFKATGVTEYLVSSLHLMLARPLSWVVAGVKPLIPEGPTGQTPSIQLSAASGWPVLAPQIPSYGSRVPLLRPRGLA